MKWETPEYSDIRFGFEVTMYINNKLDFLLIEKKDHLGPFFLDVFLVLPNYI